MGQHVGCPKRNHRQRRGGADEPLCHVLNGAVAAAGENRVKALLNSVPGLLSGFGGGAGLGDGGLHARLA